MAEIIRGAFLEASGFGLLLLAPFLVGAWRERRMQAQRRQRALRRLQKRLATEKESRDSDAA